MLFGNQGGFCKHQAAVHVQFNTPFPNCPSLTTSDRKLLYSVATGSDAMPDDFLHLSDLVPVLL